MKVLCRMNALTKSISSIFTGSAEESLPSDVTEPLPTTTEPLAGNPNISPNKTVLAPRKFRPRNGPPALTPTLSQTTAPLARANNTLTQSGGRRVRSKSKSLRSSLFLKYKYKMARRSMTMRKRCKKCGRKTCRGCKGTRKGSRRARR